MPKIYGIPFPEAKVDIHAYVMETIELMHEAGKYKWEIFQYAAPYFECGLLTIVDKTIIDSYNDPVTSDDESLTD